MVFTDGQSNSGQDVEGESRQLHEVVDQTHAIGITNGINYDELQIIASEPGFVETLDSFAMLDPFSRIFVKTQQGCFTPEKKPHRAIKSDWPYSGMSWHTAVNLTGFIDSDCEKEEHCSSTDEKMRNEVCVECSRQVARTHWSLLQRIIDAILEAASRRCFPPHVILALVSRLSVEGNQLSSTQWRACKLQKYW